MEVCCLQNTMGCLSWQYRCKKLS